MNDFLHLTGKQRHFLLLVDKQDSISKKICKRLMDDVNVDELIAKNLLEENCDCGVGYTCSEQANRLFGKKQTPVQHAYQSFSISLDDLPKC